MKIKLTMENMVKETKAAREGDIFPYCKKCFDPVIECPEEIDKSFGWQKINLSSGFKLIIIDCQLLDNPVIDFEVEQSPLEFSFQFSGKSHSSIDCGHGRNQVLELEPGQSAITYFPNSKGFMDLQGVESFQEVSIVIDPKLLFAFLEGQLDQFPPDFRNILSGDADKHKSCFSTMTPLMQMAVHQILNCPFQGLSRRMYLESKAIELIALQLAHLVNNKKRAGNPFTLRPNDVDRIHEAKDILIHDIQNPSSLVALARQVGLNEFKLKIGFRQVFGTTVFNYLRQYRMEQSRQFLKERRMNVKETASAVGYCNPSRFASAFKKQFGINPSAYLS